MSGRSINRAPRLLAPASAGYIVEVLFGLAGLIRHQRSARVLETPVQWNYTTMLNILFLALSAMLNRPSPRTGGPKMLRMM